MEYINVYNFLNYFKRPGDKRTARIGHVNEVIEKINEVKTKTITLNTQEYEQIFINDISSILEGETFGVELIPAPGVGKALNIIDISMKTEINDPIILFAISNNEFHITAYRPSTPNHKIEFDFDFNQTEIMSAPAKGRISSLIDEFDNHTNYDHSVVLLKRYETVSGSGIYNSYKDTGFGSVEVNTFGTNCNNNTMYYKVTSGILISNNTFGDNCFGNSFGNNCRNNSFRNYSVINIFGYNCFGNSFGNYCNTNSFGNDCQYNSFGEDCYNNTFGNGCSSNTIVDSCRFNDFKKSQSLNYTMATHIYTDYTCTISVRLDGTYRLQYINDSDVQVIVAANA